ncbi:MAG: hypothetical protein ABIU05_03915, partial [Nitrospirales bacterium]
MIIPLRCVSMVMVSGILLSAGCSFMANGSFLVDKPPENVQVDSRTLASQSKSLAGAYRDIGSDGSIKPHPAPSYEMSQDPRTGGEIRLGGPMPMPDLRTGTVKMETPPRPQ